MIRVMHIIHGLNTGGAETLVKEYALRIDKKKFDITILCFNHLPESPYEEILIKNNIKIIFLEDYLKQKSKKNFITKFLHKINKYLMIRKIIKKENPNILHTHLAINNYIKFARPQHQTKIIYTMHGDPQRYINESKKEYKAIKWLVNKYNMKFLCLHSDMEKTVRNIYNTSNTEVLNNGIDIEKYKISKDKSTIRKDMGIPLNCYVIGHVGRFNKIKNHQFLIEVFNEIKNHNENAFLLMIGDGNEKNNISNKLNKLNLDTSYKILSNRNDIPELLNAMDIFVFPSLSEGLGIAVIEAQEAQIPCFISDNVPDSAIISNLVTKLSLNNSEKEWAKKIINYRKPHKIEVNDKEWDINKVVKKLEVIYENELKKDDIYEK